MANYFQGMASGLAGLGKTILGIPGELLQGVSNTLFPKSKEHGDFDTWCASIGGTVSTSGGKKVCQVSHPFEISEAHHADMMKAYNQGTGLMAQAPGNPGSLYTQLGAEEFLRSLQPPQ